MMKDSAETFFSGSQEPDITQYIKNLQNVEALRRLWQEGIDSASGQYDSIEALKQEARRRFGQTNHRAV